VPRRRPRPRLCRQPAGDLQARPHLGRAGLVRAARFGRERVYELALEAGTAIRAAAARVEELSAFWDEALAAFKRLAEAEAP